MSAITDKIARLTGEDNGELNGIVNGGLLAEILTDIAAAAEAGSGASDAFIMQGIYDPRATGNYPTDSDCIDSGEGIKKGFAWKINPGAVLNEELYLGTGDILVANTDAAENDSSDWDIIQGNIVEGNLIASLTESDAIDGDVAGATSLVWNQGRTCETHFATHILLKKRTGNWAGSGKLTIGGFDISDEIALTAPDETMDIIVTPYRPYRLREGDLRYEVLVESGAALTFDVFVYGFPY